MDEVGSIYTVQGLNFSYVGIISVSSIFYDEKTINY
ncbi:TPA: DNA/RNA helicase domain-containing protein [Bacillus cereus]